MDIEKNLNFICDFFNKAVYKDVVIDDFKFNDYYNDKDVLVTDKVKEKFKKLLKKQIDDEMIVLTTNVCYKGYTRDKKFVKKIYLPKLGGNKISYKKIISYARAFDEDDNCYFRSFKYEGDDKYGHKIFSVELDGY